VTDANLSDDELLAHITMATRAMREAEYKLDELLVEAARRPTIKNPRIAAAAEIHERTLYKWLRRAWDRGHER